jgi:sulfoxide reductase heme-binding subunit YedZ
VTVPFSMSYRPAFTGLGIVAAYLAALLGLSFYARRRVGPRLWRRAHRATVLVYALGVVHALGAGSDASTPWLRWFLLVTGAPIVVLFLRRVTARRPAPLARPAAEGMS